MTRETDRVAQTLSARFLKSLKLPFSILILVSTFARVAAAAYETF